MTTVDEPSSSRGDVKASETESLGEENLGSFLERPEPGTAYTFKDAHQFREEAAVSVAKHIIYIFAAALIGSFSLALLVIGTAVFCDESVAKTIVQAMGGSLLEPIKLTSTLFSPLLAFMLGYYFSTSDKREKKQDK